MAPVETPDLHPQFLPPLAPVGHGAVQHAPEFRRVMRFQQMRQLVRDHVVDQARGNCIRFQFKNKVGFWLAKPMMW